MQNDAEYRLTFLNQSVFSCYLQSLKSDLRLNTAQHEQARVHGIDVLRGIAITLVIIHHLALPFRLPLFDGGIHEFFGRRIASTLTYSGYYGVFLFFVISGFLIADRVIQQYGSLAQINVKQFYIRRASRILPLLLVLVLALSALHFIGAKDYAINGQGQSLTGAIVATLGLHVNLYESWHGYLPGSWDILWSLSIEELFYLLFPLACLLLRSWMMPVALVLIAFSMPFSLESAAKVNDIWGEKAYLPGMAAIAFGVLGAQLHHRFRVSSNFARALLWLGIIAFIGLLLYRGMLWSTWKHLVMLFYCLTCLVLVFACANLPTRGTEKRRLWLSRFFAHIGRLSYELYLTHMFVVLTATAVYRAYFPDQLYWAFAIYPIAVVICERLAYATQKWVGAPLGRRMMQSRMHLTATR
jgi:peptidoglycan/LPS O-acetylase OafA/YrhL